MEHRFITSHIRIIVCNELPVFIFDDQTLIINLETFLGAIIKSHSISLRIHNQFCHEQSATDFAMKSQPNFSTHNPSTFTPDQEANVIIFLLQKYS